ncbi:MAG: type 1 glutamine amidotransferase [Chloroflexi bacterium]|nr:type 1 glutamine amidotransferase [Chloroflexota bacterium]
MELKGKRIAVLAEDRYQVLELWYPMIRFREAGAEVTVVGREKGVVHTSGHGIEVTADIGAAEARADDYDAVIVPGGYAPDLMRRNPAMVELVRHAYQQGKVVAAICHAGWMLASAGIVRGKRLTSFHSIKDDMVNAGAIWLDEPVVRDGNIITSRQPEDLPDFCREIIAALTPVRARGEPVGVA